jgi:hypothetical protein
MTQLQLFPLRFSWWSSFRMTICEIRVFMKLFSHPEMTRRMIFLASHCRLHPKVSIVSSTLYWGLYFVIKNPKFVIFCKVSSVFFPAPFKLIVFVHDSTTNKTTGLLLSHMNWAKCDRLMIPVFMSSPVEHSFIIILMTDMIQITYLESVMSSLEILDNDCFPLQWLWCSSCVYFVP